MTDGEWQKWQQGFRKKADPMPEIARRIRRGQVLAVLSNIAFFAIALGECAYGIRQVVVGADPIQRIAGVAIVGLMCGMGALYVAFQRGALRGAQATPDAYLAWFDRRIEIGRRLGGLTRWAGVVACSITAALCTTALMQRGAPAREYVPMVAIVGFTLAATQWVPRFTRRRMDRRREKLLRWRGELEAGHAAELP